MSSQPFIFLILIEHFFTIFFIRPSGDPNTHVVAGTMASVREHNLPNQVLSSNETMKRWPMFKLNKDEVGVYEENAGEIACLSLCWCLCFFSNLPTRYECYWFW